MTKEQHLQRLRDDPLYVILGEALSCGRTNVQTAADVLAAGVRIIQYREKHKTWREKYAEAKEIRRLCRKYDATFIMNDAVDLAVACEADGIHVGQDDAPVSFVRQWAGPQMLIGVSTHTEEEMTEAVRDGADYVGLGPFYPTQSKRDVHAPVTPKVRQFALQLSIPVVAIGGIGKANIGALYAEGFRSFAMIGAVVGQVQIAAAVQALRQAVAVD